jgi:hypothetical protein
MRTYILEGKKKVVFYLLQDFVSSFGGRSLHGFIFYATRTGLLLRC